MIDDVALRVPFLCSRLDEDERQAQAATADGETERLLAEIAAKRRILQAYEDAQREMMTITANMDGVKAAEINFAMGEIMGLGSAIRAIASVYRDQPGRTSASG
jgi:hypothetical protein